MTEQTSRQCIAPQGNALKHMPCSLHLHAVKVWPETTLHSKEVVCAQLRRSWHDWNLMMTWGHHNRAEGGSSFPQASAQACGREGVVGDDVAALQEVVRAQLRDRVHCDAHGAQRHFLHRAGPKTRHGVPQTRQSRRSPQGLWGLRLSRPTISHVALPECPPEALQCGVRKG